ncbi:hypothetical protein D3C76_1570760 [compost metagenome]
MLNHAVGPQQFCSHGTDTRPDHLANHFLEPVRFKDFNVVVDQADEVTACFFNGSIIDGGIVERVGVSQYGHTARGQTGQVFERLWVA